MDVSVGLSTLKRLPVDPHMMHEIREVAGPLTRANRWEVPLFSGGCNEHRVSFPRRYMDQMLRLIVQRNSEISVMLSRSDA